MKAYCHRKAAMLRRQNPNIEIQFILDVQKHRPHADVILHYGKSITIEARGAGDDIYASIDQAVDRVARQMHKFKGRL
jgi:ribosomal subunit interface protein